MSHYNHYKMNHHDSPRNVTVSRGFPGCTALRVAHCPRKSTFFRTFLAAAQSPEPSWLTKCWGNVARQRSLSKRFVFKKGFTTSSSALMSRSLSLDFDGFCGRIHWEKSGSRNSGYPPVKEHQLWNIWPFTVSFPIQNGGYLSAWLSRGTIKLCQNLAFVLNQPGES